MKPDRSVVTVNSGEKVYCEMSALPTFHAALSEFDIDRGNTLRCVEPPWTGAAAEDAALQGLADSMLPDGSERYDTATTWIILNRLHVPVNFHASGISFAIMTDGTWSVASWASTVTVRGGTVELRSVKDDSENRPCVIVAQTAACVCTPLPEVPLLRQDASTFLSEFADGGFGMLMLGESTPLLGFFFAKERECDALRTLLRSASSAAPQSESHERTLYGLCVTSTRRDVNARRGCVTKALALFCDCPNGVASASSLLKSALAECCTINGVDDASAQQKRDIVRQIVASAGARSRGTWQPESLVSHFTSTVRSPQNPSSLFCASFDANPFLVTAASAKMKLDFFHVVAATLEGHRVVVLGRASETVSNVCLAVAVILTKTCDNFLAERTFPYVSITAVDALTSLGHGFIAGTVNPIFESRAGEWWDVLFDADDGRMLVAADGHVSLFDELRSYHEEGWRRLRQLWSTLLMQSTTPSIEMSTRTLLHDHFVGACAYMLVGLSLPAQLRVLSRDQLLLSWAQSQRLHYTDEVVTFDADLWFRELRASVSQRSESTIVSFLQKGLRFASLSHIATLQLASSLEATKHGGMEVLLELVLHPSQLIRLLCGALLQRFDGFPETNRLLGQSNRFLLLPYQVSSTS